MRQQKGLTVDYGWATCICCCYSRCCFQKLDCSTRCSRPSPMEGLVAANGRLLRVAAVSEMSTTDIERCERQHLGCNSFSRWGRRGGGPLVVFLGLRPYGQGLGGARAPPRGGSGTGPARSIIQVREPSGLRKRGRWEEKRDG